MKRTKLQSTFLNNNNTFVKALIENIQFKIKNTESTKRRKISFPKELVENEDLHELV